MLIHRSPAEGEALPTLHPAKTRSPCLHALRTLSGHQVQIEQAFKDLKGDLAIRPVFHQYDRRIEAHIFVSFLSYCLFVTLRQILKALASGLTPRSAIETVSQMQMVDIYLPTTDGRTIVLSRYTEPEPDLSLLLDRLRIRLPQQPPPRVYARAEVVL